MKHRGRMRGGAFVGEKIRQEHPGFKTTVSGNKSGNSGGKAKRVPTGPPCTPRGTGYGTNRCKEGRRV